MYNVILYNVHYNFIIYNFIHLI